MRALVWMAGLSLGSWLVITAVMGQANPEAFFGMIGPLVAAAASWMAVERAHAAAPARVTGVLMAGFAAKVLFFGVYVAVMLRGLDLRPVPFVVSFTGYFVTLYAIEALFLKRLFDGGPQRP